MTNEYDVILSVTKALADLATVTGNLKDKLKLSKEKQNNLERENERLDNLSNQLQEQNNLLVQDIEKKDQEHERLAGFFNNNQSRVKELTELLQAANEQLVTKGKKK